MKIGTFKEAWQKHWLQYIAIIALGVILLYKWCAHGESYRNPKIDQYDH